MKVLVIGDPHGKLPEKIPNADFNLCTGDIGKADLARERFFENLERTKKGLPKLEYNGAFAKQVYDQIHYSTINVLSGISKSGAVYTLQGNVGIPNRAKSEKESKKNKVKIHCTKCKIDKMKNVYFVKNRLRILNGLRIGFLEHFVDYDLAKEQGRDEKDLKRAKKETEKAKKVLSNFGKGLDILLCHAPPYGYLDKVSGKYGAPKKMWGKHVGSKVILDYIKKYPPHFVFFSGISMKEKATQKLESQKFIMLGAKEIMF